MANVLFVCVQNAGRSQMSEALFQRDAGELHEVRSAGTEPAGRVHPEVVDAMRELGIELARNRPRALDEELIGWADVVVTMGCGDRCPVLPGKRYVDWDIPDPQGMDDDGVAEVRDEIERRVHDLIVELGSAEAAA